MAGIKIRDEDLFLLRSRDQWVSRVRKEFGSWVVDTKRMNEPDSFPCIASFEETDMGRCNSYFGIYVYPADFEARG